LSAVYIGPVFFIVPRLTWANQGMYQAVLYYWGKKNCAFFVLG